MITAVDTSVLLDVFTADPEYGERSRAVVGHCLAEGSLVACGVVWAEVAAAFAGPVGAREAMDRLGVSFAPLDVEAFLQAGRQWSAYRRHGGTRARVMADFLIGAHAGQTAQRLLTRDRGFFRSYFAQLPILDPTQ